MRGSDARIAGHSIATTRATRRERPRLRVVRSKAKKITLRLEDPKPERDCEETVILARLVKIVSDDWAEGRYRREETATAVERYCAERECPRE